MFQDRIKVLLYTKSIQNTVVRMQLRTYKHFDAQRLFSSLNRQSAFWFIKEQMRIHPTESTKSESERLSVLYIGRMKTGLYRWNVQNLKRKVKKGSKKNLFTYTWDWEARLENDIKNSITRILSGWWQNIPSQQSKSIEFKAVLLSKVNGNAVHSLEQHSQLINRFYNSNSVHTFSTNQPHNHCHTIHLGKV